MRQSESRWDEQKAKEKQIFALCGADWETKQTSLTLVPKFCSVSVQCVPSASSHGHGRTQAFEASGEEIKNSQAKVML